jgi:hypothetical protein
MNDAFLLVPILSVVGAGILIGIFVAVCVIRWEIRWRRRHPHFENGKKDVPKP